MYSTLRLLYSRIGEPYVGTPSCFSFNSPTGMCPECSGLGRVMTLNTLVIMGFPICPYYTVRAHLHKQLLSSGAAPKDVKELLGHSAVSTTMNVYAHATREAKLTSARLLDKVAGND